MAERKRPRRTRERILETSLELLNRKGVSHVTTADIAGEMNISPGNLYYHFRNKDQIVGELFAAYDARVQPLLADDGRRIDVEDLWLTLHLLFEQMSAYRFLFRDLVEIAANNRRIATRFALLLRQSEDAIGAIFRGMVKAGEMQATESEMSATARNVVLVATHWMAFDRLSRAARDDSIDIGLGVYQVLALIAPFLLGDSRALLDRLGRDYL